MLNISRDTSRFIKKDTIYTKEKGDCLYVINYDTDTPPVKLADSGIDIWLALDDQPTLAEIINTLSDQWDDMGPDAEEEILTFLETLLKNDLIEVGPIRP